jgi:hypothetical protein
MSELIDSDMIVMFALALLAWICWEKVPRDPPAGWRDRDW